MDVLQHLFKKAVCNIYREEVKLLPKPGAPCILSDFHDKEVYCRYLRRYLMNGSRYKYDIKI